MSALASSPSMDEFDRCMQRIEGHEFAVELGIASTKNLYRELLAAHDLVASLVREIARERSLASKILNRIRLIAAINHDPLYANPYDSALAAYLWSLNSKLVGLPHVAKFAAAEILKVADVWWAKGLALDILVGAQDVYSSRTARPLEFVFEQTRPLRKHAKLVRAMAALGVQQVIPEDFVGDEASKRLRILTGEVRFRRRTHAIARKKWGAERKPSVRVHKLSKRTIKQELAWGT